MSTNYSQFDNSEYAVGWIAALPHERAAAEAMLDEKHAPPQSKNPQDSNIYSLGSINGSNGKHNVVIASLPAGRYGTTAAATAAAGMLSSFPQIKFGLMVGIGGGIPNEENDIRLGDIVVSKPEGSFGGVRQYDCGKATVHGFEERGNLNSPPSALLNAASALQSKHESVQSDIPDFLDAMRKNYPLMAKPRQGPGYVYQGSENDRLFAPDYEHPSEKRSCRECDNTRQVERPERDDMDPYIFYGTIASGNQVIKDARKRDLFSQCLCFETEAAGLMNDFPCLVIRGICDYCDSHKNDQWQRYAAATAAAYAKELLQVADVQDVQNASEARGLVDDLREIRVTLQTNEKRLSENESRRRREILHATDPALDKKRIEEAKGGLLQGSYRWVLNNAEFKRWRAIDQSQLLWIKGNPGKGKTMLICGIIDELLKEVVDNSNVAYFFCQAQDNRINNATSILRGLIYMLVKQRSSLISHIPDDLPESENAWIQVRGVFLDILRDGALGSTYLIIDALDECITDLDRLLGLLEDISTSHSHVKWLVSSRDWQSIKESLKTTTHAKIDLELHDPSLSHAVQFFVEHKVKELSERKEYREDQRKRVQDHLELNANGTFLWVALVCKQLHEASKRHLQRYLHSLPGDLDGIYHRMLSSIDGLKDHDDAQLCMSLLGIVTTIYRPITLDEMPSLLSMEENTTSNDFDEKDLREIVGLCGSFLTIQHRKVTLVHQSAQDFLQRRAPKKIHPKGEHQTHYSIFSRSLKMLCSKLERNIWKLDDPSMPISEACLKAPDPNPLATIEYACIYWIDHLEGYFKTTNPSSEQSDPETLQSINLMRTLMCNQLLHWIEALSLLRSLSEGATSIFRLGFMLKKNARDADLIARVQDTYRFIIYHKRTIEDHPLQVYTSALFFTPRNVITRKQFEPNELDWFSTNEYIEEDWGQCLQTLVHGSLAHSVVFSPSRTILAASGVGFIKIWDFRSGQCLQSFSYQDDLESVTSLAFSPDGEWLASARSDAIDIWKTHSWHCLYTIEFKNPSSFRRVAFLRKDTLLTYDREHIQTWETKEWQCLHTLQLGSAPDVKGSVAFSPNGAFLACGGESGIIEIWDTIRWQCLQNLQTGHQVRSMAFSNKFLVSCDESTMTIQIWDVKTWKPVKNHKFSTYFSSIVISNDSSKLFFSCGDELQVWDTHSWQCIGIFKGHLDDISSVAISKYDTQLATISSYGSVKVWDIGRPLCLPTIDRHSRAIRSNGVDLSPDETVFVSGGMDGVIKIWDFHTGKCLKTVRGRCGLIEYVTFSPNGEFLISVDGKHPIFEVWDSQTWRCLETIEYDGREVHLIAISPDESLLVTGHLGGSLKVWNTQTWECVQTFSAAVKEEDSDRVVTRSMAFSPNGKLFAAKLIIYRPKPEKCITIWDAENWHPLEIIECQKAILSLFFTPDNILLASSANYRGPIELWDVHSWKCVQKLEGYGHRIIDLNFSRSYMRTNRGIFSLPSFARPLHLQTNSGIICGRGFGISEDKTWITWNSANLLKLPPEYFLSAFTVSESGTSIGIGCKSGHVILLHKNCE